jgi:glycosyltransferase involved in cell wall biosynthesis
MESMKKNVSIIIPTYNRCELLSYTLTSIVAQQINKSLIEVIVVDDGSDDNTKQVVECFKEALDIHYLYQEDLGFRVASARNMGLQCACGDIVIFVDSGIVLSTGCIEAHLNAHASENNAAVIGYIYCLQVHDHKLDIFSDFRQSEPDRLIDRLGMEYGDVREKVYKECDSNLSRLPAPWVLFWTGNVSARTSKIKEVGMFDANFDMHWGMEDVDLGYRLYKHNTKFILSRDARSFHYPHPSDKKKKLKDEEHNKTYFDNKHKSAESKALLTHNTVTLNLGLLAK